jgi:hypothetical protein
MIGLHFGKHLLETGTVKVGARVSIIHKKDGIGKAMFLGVLEQDVFLRLNLSRINSPKHKESWDNLRY